MVELVRALCVLALIFLNFAHAPVAAQPDSIDVLTAAISADFCGDSPGDGVAHAPCHACRIGEGAALPPPSCLPLPIVVVAAVSYGAVAVQLLPNAPPQSYAARAPPIA